MSQQLAENRREASIVVTALMAVAAFDDLAVAAADLVERGVPAADLREVAYVASLFCGFPRGVAALVALADLGGDRWSGHRAAPTSPTEARRRGEDLFRTVHGTNAERQLRMLERAHPDFADTILSEAYGRVLARDFLPLVEREVIAVVSLAVQGLGPQLRGHLLAAHNVGASWCELDYAIAQAATVTRQKLTVAQGELAKVQRH